MPVASEKEELDDSVQIQELKELVEILKESLPSEMPLGISSAVDPDRAAIFREACIHRITEISESTYKAFVEDRLIVAFILSRTIMETTALFWGFVDELKFAIQHRNIDKIQMFLTGSLVGIKSDQLKKFKKPSNPDLIVNPKNILKYIDKIDKEVSGFRLQFDVVSEFSHPNATGTVDSYVSLDWGAMIARFGKNKSKLTPKLALPQLVSSLKTYLTMYNETADLLGQFTGLCEELLEMP